MPGARIRIPRMGGGGRGRGSGSGSGASSGSGSGHGSGKNGNPKFDGHTQSRPIYVPGDGGAHSVYTTDRPRQDPACYADLKVFVDCINASPNEISVCQDTFDAFMKCRDRKAWWDKYGDYLEL
jgi:hypothetical protein